MRMSNMCEYMRRRYTMKGFIQWSEMCRGTRCVGGSCCRRLEEDVSNWGRGVEGCGLGSQGVHELIIVLMN